MQCQWINWIKMYYLATFLRDIIDWNYWFLFANCGRSITAEVDNYYFQTIYTLENCHWQMINSSLNFNFKRLIL